MTLESWKGYKRDMEIRDEKFLERVARRREFRADPEGRMAELSERIEELERRAFELRDIVTSLEKRADIEAIVRRTADKVVQEMVERRLKYFVDDLKIVIDG